MEEINDNSDNNSDEGIVFDAWGRLVQEMQMDMEESDNDEAAAEIPEDRPPENDQLQPRPPPPPQQVEEAPQLQIMNVEPARGRIRRLNGELNRRERWERHRQRRARIEMEMQLQFAQEAERRSRIEMEMQFRHVEGDHMMRIRRNNVRRNARQRMMRAAEMGEANNNNGNNNNNLLLDWGPNNNNNINNNDDNNDENNNNNNDVIDIAAFQNDNANANVAIEANGERNVNNNVNNNNNVRVAGNNAEENEDDEFDDFMMMDLGRIGGRITALRASLESVPSGLFDMVLEGRTCISVLSGWGRTDEKSCQCIVQHCANNPEEAGYISRLGRTPLHEACLRGACRHVIRALLEATNNRGADEWDFQRNTPLHLLFRDNSSSDMSNHANLVWSPQELAQVVGDLLAVNPQVVASRTNVDGDTPLHSACMAPETMVDPSTIVQLLQACPRAATRSNRKNATPLRLHCQRRNASPEVAGLLLEENPHALIVLDNERGWAPIHAAAANANFQLLRYLVESFPESVKVQTSQRQTVLHLLCQHHTHLSAVGPPPTSVVPSNGSNDHRSNNNTIPNVEAAVEFLLQADPDAIMHRDRTDGYTPLHLVCKTEGSRQVPLPVVKLLLKCNKMAASVADHQQYLPLHHACEMGSNPEVIQALVEAYPEATSALTFKKDTALSLACKANKSTETVKLLIAANPEVLTQTNEYGFCPLHCVCRAHQPRMGIVKALVEACPQTVNLQTHSGETPIQLATGAFVGIVQLLAQTQAQLRGAFPKEHYLQTTLFSDDSGNIGLSSNHLLSPYHSINSDSERKRNRSSNVHRAVSTNKMGNTPLHDACLRSTPYENLEAIAKANPEYILVHNNAGYTPLQILCKNGRIDERIISTFAQMGGPEIFAVKDSNGNTPLHSAMRKDIDLESLRCLIRASPDALRSRTTYGDLPLHLACLRKCSAEIVQEVAIAACCGDNSLAVVPNLAGQTPIGIAMGEFKGLYMEASAMSATYRPNQQRIFHVLSTLVKIVHYGPVQCQQQGTKDLSLLKACVVLHRQNIRLDPAFIRQVIHMYPEEVKLVDEEGNYPLHIEASIPIEKMSLLDGNCPGPSHRRMGILRMLLEAYPTACSFRNKESHFPLGLMIQAGRVWGHTIAVALRAFPPALHWYKGLDDRFSAILLEKASKECGADTLFALIKSRPGLFDATSHRRGALPPIPNQGR